MKLLSLKLSICLLVLALVGTSFSCMAKKKEGEYKIGVIDLMILKRQKLSAFPLANEIGADGLELDMGGLGKRATFDSKLMVDSLRKQFMQAAIDNNQEIICIAMTGYYAQSIAEKETAVQSVKDCIDVMVAMNVKTGFLPLGVQCDLVKFPEKRPIIVQRLKEIVKYAEEKNVVIAVETALDAEGELKLLKDIGSENIKISFNIASPIRGERNLYSELRTLGAKNIAQIHASNGDGVWLQNDPQVNMPKLKKTLDKMGWNGWLIVERSRDANDVRNVKGNFSANVKYLKSIFQTN
ncbi:MAG: sugar phosphate isomerase/epimerase family protein [Mangrovibacterium sp.]